MDRGEALSYYMGTDYEDLIYRYKNNNQQEIFHRDDPDLWEIHIPLPKPPRWDLIDGFGLEPEDQVYKRKALPLEVHELQDEFDTIDDIWEELRINPVRYRKVIEFIKNETWHELNGYWCFINGMPTYFPGSYYVYLSYWKGDEGFLQYRDRDRRWFVFQEYLERKNNFIGMNCPKPRRCGDTTKASALNYFRTTKKRNVNAGLQSCTLEHALEVHSNHIIAPWTELPFWLKPMHDGSSNPKDKLSFIPPAKVARTDRKTGRKGSILAKDRGLGSKMVHRASGEKAFDTFKMYSYHGDEVGKTTEADIHKRYYIIRPSCSSGSKIFGFITHTSTVEEQTKDGGENFKKLCDESTFEQQFANLSGRTTSWLANLFLAADEGLDQFVGKYGESIKGMPTTEQVEFMRGAYPLKSEDDLYIGATEYLLRERKSFELSKNYIALNNFKRQFPLYYRDCWVRAETDNGMPVNVLESRISDLALLIASFDNPVKKGNFIRVDAKDSDSDVIFVEDNLHGKFEVSYLFEDSSLSNLRIKSKGMWMPSRTDWGMAGSDDYSAKKTEGRRMSDGGGAVFMYRAKEDLLTMDISQWTGHRFVCTYKHRPATTEEYGEDLIMMCQYYGVMIFPENNLYLSPKYFIDRGYGGYLKYEREPKTGKFRKNAGWPNVGENPQRLWRKLRDHFTIHGHREVHLSFLKDLIDIPGIEKLTDYDRIVAGGSCLLGADDQTMENLDFVRKKEVDIRRFFTNKPNKDAVQNRRIQVKHY